MNTEPVLYWRILSSVLEDHADQMSDWGLKDKAAESSAAADMLELYVSNSGV